MIRQFPLFPESPYFKGKLALMEVKKLNRP